MSSRMFQPDVAARRSAQSVAPGWLDKPLVGGLSWGDSVAPGWLSSSGWLVTQLGFKKS